MQIRAAGEKRTPCEKSGSRDKQNRPELEKISSAPEKICGVEQQQRRQNKAEQSRDYQQKGL